MIMTTKWSNSVAFCFNCHRGDCLATLSSEIIWKTGGALLGDEVEGGGRRKPCKNCIEEIRSHVLMTLWCCDMSWGWSTSLERETNKNKTAIRQGHHHCKIQQWKCLTRLRVMCNKVASIITVLSWYVGVYVIFEYQSKDSLPTCPEVHLGGPVRCRNGQDRSWSKFDCGSLVGKMLWFLWRESWVVEALRREFYHNLSSEDSKGLLGGFNRRIKGTFRDFWVSSTILSLVPMLVSFLYCKCVFNCRNDSDYSGSNVLVRASISPIIPSKIRFTTPLFSLISLWYKPVELSLPPEASSFFMTSFYFLFLAALDGRGLLRFFFIAAMLITQRWVGSEWLWLARSVRVWMDCCLALLRFVSLLLVAAGGECWGGVEPGAHSAGRAAHLRLEQRNCGFHGWQFGRKSSRWHWCDVGGYSHATLACLLSKLDTRWPPILWLMIHSNQVVYLEECCMQEEKGEVVGEGGSLSTVLIAIRSLEVESHHLKQ